MGYTLPSDVRTQITAETSGFIVSYLIVNMHSVAAGTHTHSFPTDFTGLNGQPSTAIPGTYKVVFAFLATDHSCFHHQISFDCGQWFVVPESAHGNSHGDYSSDGSNCHNNIKQETERKNVSTTISKEYSQP